METQNTVVPEHVYSLVAGRLVWDPQFYGRLMANPEAALRETLSNNDAGYSAYTPQEVNNFIPVLLDHFHTFNKTIGSDQITNRAKKFLREGYPTAPGPQTAAPFSMATGGQVQKGPQTEMI